MKYILKEYEHRYEIQKSVFITYLFPLKSVDDVRIYLNRIKKEHPKATHYCYAYVFDLVMHSSDDSEPSGTAGRPMLNVLKNQDLNNILAITVRYFGGIKLGTGGLLRAYVQSLTETLNLCEMYQKNLLKKVEFIFEYENDVDRILNYLKRNDFIILQKEFLDEIHLMIAKDDFKEETLLDLVTGYKKVIDLGKIDNYIPIDK